nr:hypothetical protein [Tanacetum cinerariifolium]
MDIIVKDVLFSERNLRKICLHNVLKIEFSKILLSHPMTIPMLLMLFKSHSLAIKTPYGYNCPPKVPVVPDPEPFNNQTIEELPLTVASFDSTCYSKDRNSFTYDSTSNLVHDSPNVFNPPSKLLFYSCEFCGNNARYGYYYTPQVLFIYLEPCYNQDFDLPQYFHDFQQQYLCCENCGVTHEAYQYNIISGLPPCAAITPSLSTEEPDNSPSMGDEHLDTVPATESDEFIKFSVESLVTTPSESEGIPDNMCDVPFHDNSPSLGVSKDQFEDFSDSNDESTSIDDDSFSIDNIEYVEASPLDSELVSSEVMEIVILEVGGIDD